MRTLYLHGFLSSPDSTKAIKLRQAHEKAGIPYSCPTLHVDPHGASEIILQEIESFGGEDFCVIGTSLGGFYASWVANKFGKRAVLLNPVVYPWVFMENKMGYYTIPSTGKSIYVGPEYRDQLLALKTEPPVAKNDYLIILGTGDEVLDWQEAAKFYEGCPRIIVEGADHRLSNFDPLVPKIMDFVQKKDKVPR